MKTFRFRVGAAVGSGMAARAAESAGADFILVLGASKMRSMGVASPASLLPIYDAVDFTIDFAISEILPRVELPTYVGLPLFDPRLQCDELVVRLKSLGIQGLTNFPAVFHFGERAQILEQHGLGRDREIEFLLAASNAGLNTIGYVRNRAEANAMVAAGISTICINFSLNPPKPEDTDDIDKSSQLVLAAKDIVESVRRPNRNLTIYLGGGPILGGAGMDKFCRNAGIDGFIGGSALDRAPLEKSLLKSVASFREIQVLRNQVEQLERELNRVNKQYGLVCQSIAMDTMLDQVETAIELGTHIAIRGEAETGRMDVADMIAHRLRHGSRREVWKINIVEGAGTLKQLYGSAREKGNRRLVGVLELSGPQTPIILKDVEQLSLNEQEDLARFLVHGQYCPVGDETAKHSNARLIILLDPEKSTARGKRPLAPCLSDALAGHEISVPPLRDRIEDIPLLAQQYAAKFGVKNEDFPSLVIRTLVRHNWPGNLKEFEAAIGWLAGDKALSASEDELIAHIGGNQTTIVNNGTISRRDRIIQALLLNNLSRTKTAEYLGISRKTLYNQIRKHDILN